jgi:hypothetical protein
MWFVQPLSINQESFELLRVEKHDETKAAPLQVVEQHDSPFNFFMLL